MNDHKRANRTEPYYTVEEIVKLIKDEKELRYMLYKIIDYCHFGKDYEQNNEYDSNYNDGANSVIADILKIIKGE